MEHYDLRLGKTMIDTIMEIESIVKAVESKLISRSVANGLIRNILEDIPPHPMEMIGE